jgi:cell division topological specificity factor
MGLASLFDRLFGRNGDSGNAANAAKDRLRLVLMHDRTDIPATMMEAIRAEMIEVLTKYVDIDQAALEVQLEKEQGAIGLVLNIPIRRVKNADEAAAAVAAAQRLAELKAQLQDEAAQRASAAEPAVAAAEEATPEALSAAVWPTIVVDGAGEVAGIDGVNECQSDDAQASADETAEDPGSQAVDIARKVASDRKTRIK